ncbi:RNase H-like domain found in reverse transcriptase [Popillia japonica]|uniref:RNA-directed DNA polymerase n=1 Tax=Popillia japonica TaxID=7064 RepID=A0AAW1LQE8_POPJA
MSKITAPLRLLTRQDTNWHWVPEHDKALVKLTTAPVLSFFNSTKPIVIETDASKNGLGACLLQDGHPIAFASRSLNSTEQKYAQDTNINTDHKPLESIFKKDLASITPRLQRMRLLYIADTLSRAFLSDQKMRARNIFYWPGLSTDIELFIKKCKTCEKTARKNHKEKLLPHPIPQRPWERLGVDIFTYANISYLVVYDAYSNWLELLRLKDKSAETAIPI